MQMPKAACLEAFPHLVRLLGAEANVTHSYAAIAIDRLLTQKVLNTLPGCINKVTSMSVSAALVPTFSPLLRHSCAGQLLAFPAHPGG